jgi:hypothetical protein
MHDPFPLVPKRDIQAGDVWVGDGKSWNTEPPTEDMHEKVVLLKRAGKWVGRDG